jgi:hypothetical protein
VAFKQDWDTQAREAEGFLGGESSSEVIESTDNPGSPGR